MTTLALRRAIPRAGDLDAALGGDTLAELVRQFKVHGDAFRMHAPLLGRDVFVLSHPDHVRHLLVDQHARFEKGIGIERVRILLGNGLMTSEGARWRSQRKAIQPAFHRQRIQAQVPDIVAANERLAIRIAAAGAEPFDLGRHLSEITLEVVLRALFGAAYDALVAGDNPFALLTDEAERDLRFAYALRKLGGLLQGEIDRRRGRDGGASHGDLLQTLIEARDRHTGEPMSDRQICDEVFTLVVAGHETTASALCWTWHLVAGHPAVAAAIRAEADAASEAERRQPAPDRFPHAHRAIAEALRLYPPGWVLTRRALEATSIAGVDVERGDDILVSPFLVHRHPAFWNDAEAFDPARFLPERSAARSRFAYLPFGLGPRACIGEPLALAEMLAHVVTLAHRCELRLVPGQRVEWDARVNLRPRTPILFTATPRRAA